MPHLMQVKFRMYSHQSTYYDGPIKIDVVDHTGTHHMVNRAYRTYRRTVSDNSSEIIEYSAFVIIKGSIAKFMIEHQRYVIDNTDRVFLIKYPDEYVQRMRTLPQIVELKPIVRITNAQYDEMKKNAVNDMNDPVGILTEEFFITPNIEEKAWAKRYQESCAYISKRMKEREEELVAKRKRNQEDGSSSGC